MAAPPSPWLVEPCPPEEAARLAEELGVRRTTAEVLIRRGHSTPDAARAFLEQDGPAHDPMLLGDMAAACERIERAIAAGERVCVHGDYDADGICATALAADRPARARRPGRVAPARAGSRRATALAVETVERLAGDGVSLLLTVDCGITAADAVARARELGMDVIVTDHHRPAEMLPECIRGLHPPVGLPVPGAVRDRRRVQARPGAPRPRRPRPGRAGAPPRPGRAGDRRRRRAASRREPRARAGGPAPAARARQSPACGR